MSVTRELIEQERQQVQAGRLRDVHLHKEGTFSVPTTGVRFSAVATYTTSK